MESLLTSLRHDLNQKTAEVKMIYAQRDERVKEIAELECTVRDLQDDQDDTSQSRDQLVHDLAEVEKEILVKEKELKEILPKLTTSKDKEAKIKQRYFLSIREVTVVLMKLKEKNHVFVLNKDDKFNSRAEQSEIKLLLQKSIKFNNS